MKKHKPAKAAPPISITPLKAIIFLLPFAVGGYHEFVSCLLSIALFAYLVCAARRRGSLNLCANSASLAVLLLVLGYAVTSLWAVDSGAALVGFVKFLPLLPLSLILMQLNSGEKQELFDIVALSGVVMTALSFSLKWFDVFGGFFTVSGRLAGFFQYPNAFALFLLLGLIVTGTRERLDIKALVFAAVLIFGIFDSGSRIVFFLTLAAVFALCVLRKERALRISLLAVIAVGVAATVIYAVATGNVSTAARYLSTSLGESTFVGRILYYKDALPVILRHPFGMGYLGYYFTQSGFQTGVYSVMFIHNDLLQILLDVGWIPAAAFVLAAVRSFFSKASDLRSRMLILAVCAHCMLDFDLQFISIFAVLLIALDFTGGRQKKITGAPQKAYAALAVSASVSVYFCVTLFAQYLGRYDLAYRAYPLNTVAQTQLMVAARDIESANAHADSILGRNDEVAVAYSAKARYEYSRGNIEKFIEYKNIVFDKAPYGIEEYEDYGNKLLEVIKLYERNGDTASVNYCKKELGAIEDRLDRVRQKTDTLAWKIDDKPVLELSEELAGSIAKVR